MKINELYTYHLEEFFDFETVLNENDSDYTVKQSTNFKKGLKKHNNDKKVMSAFKDIMNQLKQGTQPQDLPQEYNPHIIKKSFNNMWKDYWDVHLKGQKIIMLFKVDHDEKVIRLAHLGTHQEAKI